MIRPGLERNSTALNLPWNTVTTIVKRKYGATVKSLTTGCPAKIDGKTLKKMVTEAAKRSSTTVQEIEQSSKYWLLPTSDNNLLNSS